jgi:hypothetical protein
LIAIFSINATIIISGYAPIIKKDLNRVCKIDLVSQFIYSILLFVPFKIVFRIQLPLLRNIISERARDEVQVRRLIAARNEVEGCGLDGGSVTSMEG